ncbi:hypothetical protein EKO04_003423 [Ascochyta lentis]|uniref:Heme haloperoxidase family profile domain-containing protein n=1 Tax=Ascochyta lentis TaxID=205686 RepID=A0A8H7MLG6_9PLEO|nr:hypothetical protein EKO04_003423 [Ascochyta lentis]
MSSEGTPLLSGDVPKGTYAPAGPGDKRSPCPMINSLANHGYLPRDGRSVLAHEITAAMNETGISATLSAMFVNAIYNVHKEKDEKDNSGVLSRLWTTVRDPWTLLSKFGMRRPDQTDSCGRPILDLDQLALPGAVEHDISLTRRDHGQKEGNCARQEDLVDDLLASSIDGKNVTREDLANLRKRRIAQQREDNPSLTYGALQHEMSCGEIALILGVFGDGKSAPCDFLAPFLREERLPIKEGWKKRWWWTLGLVEVKIIGTKVKSLIGLQIK